MSDTPPNKKARTGKFSSPITNPSLDARAWVAYNGMHNEINLFFKGLQQRMS